MAKVITKAEAARKYKLPRQTIDDFLERYIEDGTIGPKSRGGRRISTVKKNDNRTPSAS